jgi:hypothetical protein
MGGACSLDGERRGVYRVLVGKEPLGRPRLGWENNIKINLQEVCWSMEWIELAQDTDRWREIVMAVMNLRFP